MLYPVMEWREGLAFFEMLYDLSCKSASTEEAYNYFFKTYSNFTGLYGNDVLVWKHFKMLFLFCMEMSLDL